jgi:hypothetical protein
MPRPDEPTTDREFRSAPATAEPAARPKPKNRPTPDAGRVGDVTATAVDTATALARDVYFFGYPIVLMDLTMRQVTAVPDATAITGRAPINQFAHFRAYPGADAKDIVRFNFDTLYSFAWIDLEQGPVILTVPDSGGRYYLVPALDMWTDVFSSLGSRTTGTKAGHFGFVPPGWRGELPAGVTRVEAPTSMIWMLGRTQTNGPADYANVHQVQDGLKLTPLAQWGKPYAPPATSPVDSSVDIRTPPQEQVGRMTGVEMFTRLATLMKKYPPHYNDYPMVFRMKALGLEPGKDWDVAKLDRSSIDAINAAAKQALEVLAGTKTMGRQVNGWNVLTENIGTYGTSYRQRALVAYGGLGANLPDDAVYPMTFVDGDGELLDGANKYILHFDRAELPPANAFWSLTMYDGMGFQVANRLDRFAIGDRDELRFNADGSLDLYIQAESPGAERASNWLPAPRSGVMAPTLRLYSPRPEVLDGTWAPPPIRRVS